MTTSRTLPRRGRTRRLLGLMVLFALAVSTLAAAARDGGAYEIDVEFPRTYNLFPGSPVKVLGVDVGVVADLRIAPGSDLVTTTLRIEGDRFLPADSTARIIPASLLGERYVQVDAYREGPTMEPGATIPVERTGVPAEFDEVLESLNNFVGGLDEQELARLIENLADNLVGNGTALGRTIDQAHLAIQTLQDNDEELIALISRLSDLNATLSTRERAMGQIIEDWFTVTRNLADDGDDIEAALTGLVRITEELGGVLETNRENLDDDIDTLTRLTRTVDRNIDHLSLMTQSGAELFRHTERVFDFEHNWLPLVNHFNGLEQVIAGTLAARLVGVCDRAELPADVCAGIDDVLGGALCAVGIVPCESPETPTIGEGLTAVFEAFPELAEVYGERAEILRAGEVPDDVPDPLRDRVRRNFGGDS